MKYLEAESKTTLATDVRHPLLPLSIGNYWEMTAYCQDPKVSGPIITHDRYIVTRQVNIDGVAATEVEILRNGGKWRRELYRPVGDGVELVAGQDENSELMTYNPPIPLFKYPAKEGDYQTWVGTFRIKNIVLPARAQSRVTSQENLKTPAGIFKTLRIDTVIAASQKDNMIRFISVRWLAPGIGFARRFYVDKGRSAMAEVTRFNVR